MAPVGTKKQRVVATRLAKLRYVANIRARDNAKRRAAAAATRAKQVEKKQPAKRQSIGWARAHEASKAEKDAAMKEALVWCESNGKGAVACLSANPHLSGLIKKDSVHRRIQGLVVDGKTHHQRILTNVEEGQLVDYLIASNLGRDGQTFTEIGVKVHEILLVRRAQNRRGGRKFIPFNSSAEKIIKGDFPSQAFFTFFLARHAQKLQMKVKQNVEQKRAVAARARIECCKARARGCFCRKRALFSKTLVAIYTHTRAHSRSRSLSKKKKTSGSRPFCQ